MAAVTGAITIAPKDRTVISKLSETFIQNRDDGNNNRGRIIFR
jgi:hypothetical protein